MSTTAVAEVPEAHQEAGPSGSVDDDALLKAFFSDMRDVDRDNEVKRIIWAFKLNPFEKLNLRFDASVEDINRQYRKLSLMVHPDKCKNNPQAPAAFDMLREAQKELLDEEKRQHLDYVLGVARDDIRKERRKMTKNDNVIRLASVLHEDGLDGIQAEWEKTDEFHEKWRLKARDLLANSEWRKRKLGKRIKAEEERVEEEEKADREHMKKAREHAKDWEKTRETRVGTWRDFQTKSKGKKAAGELKPPKLKTNDEERLYVQRPVPNGEQFRPPPPKSMAPVRK